MPIYAYTCTKCGAEPEYIQKFSDPPMRECEACGGELKRQITAAAFHLKGGGWYKDGYASSKPDTGGEGGDKTGAGEGKADKRESKSAGGDGGGSSDASSTTSSSPKPSGGASGGASGGTSGGTSASTGGAA